MTAVPPWVLAWHVVTATLPQPAVVARPAAEGAIDVAWPRVRVVQDQPRPAPRAVRPHAPPQGPWRLPLPQGHPLRNMAWAPPTTTPQLLGLEG